MESAIEPMDAVIAEQAPFEVEPFTPFDGPLAFVALFVRWQHFAQAQHTSTPNLGSLDQHK